MSTEATQTLFRFTSLRNPELAQSEGNYGFINRSKFLSELPGGGPSFFDKILQEKTNTNQTKLAYLLSRANEFKNQDNYIQNIEYLEKIVNLEYYDAINIYDDDYKPIVSVAQDIEIISNLWDNLIYQVLTEENFYLKEKIIEIFKKDNYNQLGLYKNSGGAIKNIFSEKETEKRKKLAREAKVVLPEELFVENSGAKIKRSKSSKINALELKKLKEKTQKESIVSKAKLDKADLEELKNDLLKTQKDYNKGYNKALKLAQDKYQKSIQSHEEAYSLALLEAEANLPTEATEAQRKLTLANVSKPNFNAFDFQFNEQLDKTFLESKLSSKTLETLANVVGLSDNLLIKKNDSIVLDEKSSSSKIIDSDQYETLADILISVEDQIKKQDELIIANTEVEKEQFINIGGIFLPINTKTYNTLQSKLPEYSLCTKEIGKTFNFEIDFSFYVPNQSYVIKDVAYSTTDSINSYTFEGSQFTLLRDINHIKLTKIWTNNGNDFNEFPVDDYFFSIKINFTNGLTYDFIDIPIVLNGCTKDLVSSGNGTDGFIPSGFGVRRLGIADYLKVEQSTHAYVPGEVAHIENIMAREYREKSTRRTTRTEDTITTSSEAEREQLTDTTTATRFDMQTEIAKMMAETTDASTSVSSSFGKVSIGASFAHNRSKDESSRTAVTQAKDITERALDRLVSKIKEERIRKVVEEFEENNIHGFDNRKGDKNVVGVYRWVDKIMKNQIFNYGKRLTFEFMIPQPSKINNLAMLKESSKSKMLDKPLDPRTSKNWNLYLPSILETPSYESSHYLSLKYWAGIYNVDINDQLSFEKKVSVSFSDKKLGVTEDGRWSGSYNKEFEIDEQYIVKAVEGSVLLGEGSYDKGVHPKAIVLLNGKEVIKQTENNIRNMYNSTNSFFRINEQNLNISDKISLSAQFYDVETLSGSLLYTCNLKKEYLSNELRRIYNQIISAYEDALAVFEEKVSQSIPENETNIKETNANFYRQIESDVLKHNCMSYLVDPDKLGSQLYTGDDLLDFSIKQNEGMDEYASLVKFMEQAFEWNIMSYDFYPYYWGAKTEWQSLYQSESIDPLFRSFLQSGMARVVVTVKPGFEDAVQFYMTTGKIWNGGEIPVIGDPMYISIVEEMREPVGDKVGKFWLTKLPTSLNILQAESIGLTVEEALPFTNENAKDCENPEMIVKNNAFRTTKSLLNGGEPDTEEEKEIKVEDVIIGNWTDTTSIE